MGRPHSSTHHTDDIHYHISSGGVVRCRLSHGGPRSLHRRRRCSETGVHAPAAVALWLKAAEDRRRDSTPLSTLKLAHPPP